METTDNLALWNRVEVTDPKDAKKITERGGYTAICAQSQIRNATIEWGPYGSTWGVRGCEYGHLPDAAGEIVEVTLEAEFFYPGGAFELSTDIKYRPGNDTRKKLLTDLTTKALSKLGFNADVFMGRFDDDKYVEQTNAQFREADAKAAPPTGPEKVRVVKAIADYLKSKGSTMDPTMYFLKVSAQEVEKPKPGTQAELEQIEVAILADKYTPDSGEKVPA